MSNMRANGLILLVGSVVLAFASIFVPTALARAGVVLVAVLTAANGMRLRENLIRSEALTPEDSEFDN